MQFDVFYHVNYALLRQNQFMSLTKLKSSATSPFLADHTGLLQSQLCTDRAPREGPPAPVTGQPRSTSRGRGPAVVGQPRSARRHRVQMSSLRGLCAWEEPGPVQTLRMEAEARLVDAAT